MLTIFGLLLQNHSWVGEVDDNGGQNWRSVGRIEMHRETQRQKTVRRKSKKAWSVQERERQGDGNSKYKKQKIEVFAYNRWSVNILRISRKIFWKHTVASDTNKKRLN